ncbi:hypothetical protein [Lactobacillus sp. UBA5813]|nr:hypothetical protein [Lactobacillus sp. UBA5813]
MNLTIRNIDDTVIQKMDEHIANLNKQRIEIAKRDNLTLPKKLSRNQYLKLLLGQDDEEQLKELELIEFKKSQQKKVDLINELVTLVSQLLIIAFEGDIHENND